MPSAQRMLIDVAVDGKSALFLASGEVAIPPVCVVCVAKANKMVGYQQDHIPITLPGIAFLRWTNVKMPYCEQHAAALRRRFRRLFFVQGLLYVIAVVSGMIAFYDPLRIKFGFIADAVIFAVPVATFFLLVISIFVVKPRLYDVFINHTPQGIRVTCKNPEFIDALVRANSESRV